MIFHNILYAIMNKPKSVLETESSSSDTFAQFNQVIIGYKDHIEELELENSKLRREISILERAIEIQVKKNHIIKNPNNDKKSDVRQIVQELYAINTRKRNDTLQYAELDAEAAKILKRFE